MFKSIDPHPNFPKLEEEVLKFWDENKIFQKSLENRKDSPRFIFYDGPPFANGLPHYGHILAMTIKDVVTRFKTEVGFFVPRRGGWDTHGLPVEYEVEKELGISGKEKIEKYGVEKFNQKARESVMKYTKEWIKTMERMGRWIDWENAYTTMDRDYIESVWWVFKQIYDKGLVYEGYKSLPYCPRCGTPLSNFEVNQGYRDNVEDPSVILKFKIQNHELKNSFLLAWTTTPWTLPGNTALAIGNNIDYVEVKVGGDFYILAKDRLEVIDDKYEIVKALKADDLIGLNYEPLYDMRKLSAGKKIYEVVEADFVTIEDGPPGHGEAGTGVVHIAPAFGEDDLELAQKENLALVKTVEENGNVTPKLKIPGEGKFVKAADKDILDDLENRNLLYKKGTIRHTYPFCWRCETPLLYFAMSTWFVKVSQLRDKLVKNNEEINWVPKYLKIGRFGKWLAEARDWAISRNRYWGAPIPIWCHQIGKSEIRHPKSETNSKSQIQKCQNIVVVGSIKELKELSVKSIDVKNLDLHKPYIDNIELKCDKCGGKMRRIPEVLDCWFESGSMPYAQNHYPFENKENFNQYFPADFIAEGLDQTRGWFYTLHVISSILFDSPAFQNVVTNGIVLASDGKKLSKRLRNYDEPAVIFDSVGVDALRYFLLSSTPMGEDYRFSTEGVKMTVRKTLLPLWHTFLFFITYAEIDNWQPAENNQKEPQKVLNKWLMAKLNQTNINVREKLDAYDLTRSSREIENFITDLSQWYLRRSRAERNQEFYSTLYYVLKEFVKIMAPFMPFISETIYQKLRTKKEPESVHLCDWPSLRQVSAEQGKINKKLILDMQQVREVAEKGHSLRAEKGIRLRQPLEKIEVPLKLEDGLKEILKDELNVLKIEEGKVIKLDTKITPELKSQGIMRDIVRHIQDLRKKAGLLPGEKIDLYYSDEGNIAEQFKDKIEKLTNTKLLKQKVETTFQSDYNLDGQKIWLGLKK